MCWLSVYEAEWQIANAKDMNMKIADYWQRRLTQANKRYLQAVKMLATVRRLAIPVLLAQVNIVNPSPIDNPPAIRLADTP